MIEKLLQRDVVDFESVPNLVQLDFAVGSLVFHLGTGNGLTESEEWQSQVDEAVLELLNVILAIDDLVKLKDDEACDKGSGGGNGWDNLARNELGLVSIGRLNLVILCS